MSETFKYDVFISYSSKDKDIVLELAKRLKADRLRVWLDDWEIHPGDMIGLKISRGLEQSRTLVLVISANASDSEWVTFETQTILFNDPTNQQRRFIPLRLDDAKIKDTLKQFAYIDWRTPSPDEYRRLLASCRPAQSDSESVPPAIEILNDQTISLQCTDDVWCIAISNNGHRVAFGHNDKTVRVWDLQKDCGLAILEGHTGNILSVALSIEGRRAISGSDDKTARVWDIESGHCIATLIGHSGPVYAVALSEDGRLAASGSGDDTVRLWDIKSECCIAVLQGHTNDINSVAWSHDDRYVVSAGSDWNLRVWNVEDQNCKTILKGHTDLVYAGVLSKDGRRIISGSDDRTLRVWDVHDGVCLAILEGHTNDIWSVAWSEDDRRAISGSDDGTVRVWDTENGRCIAILRAKAAGVWSVGWSADGQRVLAGTSEGEVWGWSLPKTNESPVRITEQSTRYTNAKVLIVGDSGVGKTGLAIRLTRDRFESTISTDAALVTQLKLPSKIANRDIQREIWLWDFAGQADYRLIHRLFMDEISLAVIVFNPQSENPFEGMGQWDRDLQRAARQGFRKLLVASRIDRGGLMVSRGNIQRFVEERGFTEYLEVSAYTGVGCDGLRDSIIRNIPWDDIPWIASPRIFKLLKDEILKLKDDGKVLLRMRELKQQLEMRLPSESFTHEELRSVVGLLASPTVIWHLEFGDFVLLEPERINAYGAAVIRKVRTHTEEIGCILEEDVLAGSLDYQGMQRLPPDEEQIVLRAMHQTFVDRGFCLREHTDAGTLLVFPSYFKRERPELEGHPAVFVTYRFNGQLDEIYASLVVRLHYSAAFERDQLWRFAVDFKTQAGKRLGLKMTRRGEGAAEIAVYFDPAIPDETKVIFIRYVHDHLRVRAQDVIRMRSYVCPNCDAPVENRRATLERLNRGLRDIVCVICEKRIPLWDLIEEKFASDELQQRVREMEDEASAGIDNESKELVLIGHAFAIAGEAGQIFRPTANSDWGIDGEVEFKNSKGEASGKRVYLQLKSGDSYLHTRARDGREIFTISKRRHAEYWMAQAYPVMLVIRTSDGQIRWMNVTDYLTRRGKASKQVVFEGEPFTALSLAKLRDRLLTDQ
jgi:small GTP-binding protein